MENLSSTVDKKLVLAETNLSQSNENATAISVAMENGSAAALQPQRENGSAAAPQPQRKKGSAAAPQPPNRTGVSEKNLSMLAIGESGRIKTVLGEGKVRRRLFDMGLTPGAEVYMKKRAPLGDPIELTVRGYSLSLRKSEAANIIMEVITK